METSATTTRAVLYLRISLDAAGNGLAIERQREICERIAAERGWVIVGVYVDNVSAFRRDAKRPDYDRMVAAYKAGVFDALVCYDLDRLTRQPRQLEDWIDAAEGRGLKLVTANGEADLTTDGGRMYARIKAAVARSESERKGARQVAAARQRASLGRMQVGGRAYGFTQDGVPVDEPAWCEVATRQEVSEAQIVREMFARFHAGDSVAGMARWLNGRGTPTGSGGPWGSHTVRRILINPRYAGIVVYKRDKLGAAAPSFPGSFPAIVDEAVFAAVAEKLADPRRKKQFGTGRKHLGSGLYQCGICGRRVRAHGGPLCYKCPDRHVTRTAAPIDDLVIALIRERLAKPDIAQLAATRKDKESVAAAEDAKRLRARIKQTQRDYDADLIDGERYREKTGKLRAELEQAEALRLRLAAGTDVAATLTAADPVKAFDDAPLGVRQSVIRFFCTVELLHVPRGKRFRVETVRITPRHSTP